MALVWYQVPAKPFPCPELPSHDRDKKDSGTSRHPPRVSQGFTSTASGRINRCRDSTVQTESKPGVGIGGGGYVTPEEPSPLKSSVASKHSLDANNPQSDFQRRDPSSSLALGGLPTSRPLKSRSH